MTGWWLSRTRGIPFVLEIRDLWPDAILASGVGNDNSMFSKTLSAISGFLYQNCDHLVVVTPAFKAEIVRDYGINPEKISIVENGVETELFSDKGETKAINDQPGFENKFVVSYVGTHGLAHGLSTMLQAASRLQEQYPDILFLLVGEGADKEHLVKLAKNRGLTNVSFLPQQPREKVPAIIRASDVCMVMLKKAPIFKTVIPTKMLEFMACARPVILGVDGQARQVLEEAEGGVFTEPDDPDALADTIIRLYEDATLRNTLGQNGR
jgi:glycosyltransferase involved in cell wall biosynthesis